MRIKSYVPHDDSSQWKTIINKEKENMCEVLRNFSMILVQLQHWFRDKMFALHQEQIAHYTLPHCVSGYVLTWMSVYYNVYSCATWLINS